MNIKSFFFALVALAFVLYIAAVALASPMFGAGANFALFFAIIVGVIWFIRWLIGRHSSGRPLS